MLALDVADDVHDLGHVRGRPALVDDGDVHVQVLGQGAGAHHAADVRGDDDHVVQRMLADVVEDDRGGVDVVHGDVEEALDLPGMQVHSQHACGAGGGQHVGDELGGDRRAAGALAVLAGIAEVGDDGADLAGGGALGGIDGDQQLHQVVIGRGRGALDDEDVLAADGLLELHEDLAVGEALDVDLALGKADVLADRCGQRRVRCACEKAEAFAVHGSGGSCGGIGPSIIKTGWGGRMMRCQAPCPCGAGVALLRRCLASARLEPSRFSSCLSVPRRSFAPAACLAGAAGFEPTHDGIKTRCLTAWRRPNPHP